MTRKINVDNLSNRNGSQVQWCLSTIRIQHGPTNRRLEAHSLNTLSASLSGYSFYVVCNITTWLIWTPSINSSGYIEIHQTKRPNPQKHTSTQGTMKRTRPPHSFLLSPVSNPWSWHNWQWRGETKRWRSSWRSSRAPASRSKWTPPTRNQSLPICSYGSSC